MAGPIFPSISDLGAGPAPQENGISQLGQLDWYNQVGRLIDQDREARAQKLGREFKPQDITDRNRIDADRYLWDHFNSNFMRSP